MNRSDLMQLVKKLEKGDRAGKVLNILDLKSLLNLIPSQGEVRKAKIALLDHDLAEVGKFIGRWK